MRGCSNAKRMVWRFSSCDSANRWQQGQADEQFEPVAASDSLFTAVDDHNIATDEVCVLRATTFMSLAGDSYIIDDWSRIEGKNLDDEQKDSFASNSTDRHSQHARFTP